MKNFILLLSFSLYALCVSSQNYVELLKLNAGTTPYNTFDSGGSRTRVNEMMADITLPVKLSEKLSLVTGLIYESIQARLFSDGPVITFGSTTLKLGVNKLLTERWAVTLVALPKIASDHTRTGRNDFQAGALGILKFKKRSDLTYKAGLYYNSELFGPFFVPMLGFYYLGQNKKLEANLMLPLQADVNYKVLPFMNAGVNFNGQIRSYHLTGVAPGHSSTYVARSVNELFFYLKFNISKNFSIMTKVGHTLGRSYRVYDMNDKVTFGLPAIFVGGNRQQLNSDFSNGAIFQVGLLYRVNIEKK